MPIDLDRIKGICFDIDGTLSNTDDQFVEMLVKLLSPVKLLFRIGDVLPVARRMVMFSEGPGNWIYSVLDELGLDNSIVVLSELFYKLGFERSLEPYLLIDGVRELLSTLMENYPLSIVSARGHNATYRFLTQFELSGYFKAICSSQTTQHTKPFAEPVLWAAENMGVPAANCLMVGDTVVDIISGKKAGAQTVGVLCGFGEELELRKAGADLILDSTADLMKLFAQVILPPHQRDGSANVSSS